MLDRRRFLGGLLAGTLWVAGGARRLRAAEPAPPPPPLGDALLAALRESPYVYVSPLLGDGRESRCHAEVWFAWIDGAVVMTVASDGWKTLAVERGLDRARLWVGDRGRLKGLNAGSQAFRELPSFDASAAMLWDDALNEKLLAAYAVKYPEEIGRWGDRMRRGHADRSRVLMRYTPLAARPASPRT